jgi:hypothetical protein
MFRRNRQKPIKSPAQIATVAIKRIVIGDPLYLSEGEPGFNVLASNRSPKNISLRFRFVRSIVRRIPEKQIYLMISIGFGGRGGIRTHGTLAGTPVFKTGALNHSATLPNHGCFLYFI